MSVAWSKGAIRAILRNPRYTGYQVWNRQRKQEVLVDVDNVALGCDTKPRRRTCHGDSEWPTSTTLTETWST